MKLRRTRHLRRTPDADPLRTAVLAGLLSALAIGVAMTERQAAAEAPADPVAIPAGPAPHAPAAPTDPAAAEVARAIREARKELEAIELQAEKESRELGGRIAEETQGVFSLRDEEKKLATKLRSLEAELIASQGKLASLMETVEQAGRGVKAVEAELISQAGGFRERFAGSLAAAADPKLLENATEALNPNQPISERLSSLLEAYEGALRQARSVATVRLPLLISSAGEEKAEKLACLRLGLLGGLYARPARGEGGFVVPDAESKTGFLAESKGLDRERMQRIIAIVQKPEKGGFLPTDVTGGAAIASLRSRDTLAQWFERGGKSLWAISGLAVLAAATATMRGAMLAFQSVALGRRIPAIADLVRIGQVESAASVSNRKKDAAGSVLGAAMECRDLERPAMEAAVEEALLRQTRRLRAGLGLITLCGALAPLIGFLGTATGMFGVFRMLEAIGFSDSRFLAGGVAEALIATEAGLYLAILCLVARALLGALAERASEKLEAGALTTIIALLKRREAPIEVGGAV